MSKKKIKTESITQVVNYETGEIQEETKTASFFVDKEPDYIKMYIDDITRINDLPKGLSPILLELIKQMGYNNVIAAYKPIKMMVADRLGISLNYLNTAIRVFHEKGLLIRVHRGVYIADPNLFARGKWEDIKNLRLVIEYKQDGTKKLKSNLPEEVQLRLKF